MLRTTGGPWPDQIDATATLIFFTAIVVLPILGYYFMALDFRAYLRSLRRALVRVTSRFFEMPEWARPYTPRCFTALGLSMPCTEAELLDAYRQRAKQLHPDRGGDQRQFLRFQAHFEESVRYLRSWQVDLD